MKFIVFLGLIALSALDSVHADGHKIVHAAREQIGIPYAWGGGGIHGKSRGTAQGANTIGFDCSSLAQYSVYHGTGKTIARTANQQFVDKHCHHVAYENHKPGDLVFFESGGIIHHVGIVSGHGKMINAPHTGDHIREADIYTQGLIHKVARCW